MMQHGERDVKASKVATMVVIEDHGNENLEATGSSNGIDMRWLGMIG